MGRLKEPRKISRLPKRSDGSIFCNDSRPKNSSGVSTMASTISVPVSVSESSGNSPDFHFSPMVWTPRAEFFGRGKVVNIVGQLAFRLEYSMIVTGEFLVAKSQVDALI